MGTAADTGVIQRRVALHQIVQDLRLAHVVLFEDVERVEQHVLDGQPLRWARTRIVAVVFVVVIGGACRAGFFE